MGIAVADRKTNEIIENHFDSIHLPGKAQSIGKFHNRCYPVRNRIGIGCCSGSYSIHNLSEVHRCVEQASPAQFKTYLVRLSVWMRHTFPHIDSLRQNDYRCLRSPDRETTSISSAVDRRRISSESSLLEFDWSCYKHGPDPLVVSRWHFLAAKAIDEIEDSTDQRTRFDQATQLALLFSDKTIGIATAGTVVEVFALFAHRIVVPHDFVLITTARVLVQRADV